jgi:hypothetical protein
VIILLYLVFFTPPALTSSFADALGDVVPIPVWAVAIIAKKEIITKLTFLIIKNMFTYLLT